MLLELEEGIINPAFIQCIERGVGEVYKEKYIITLVYKSLVISEESLLRIKQYSNAIGEFRGL